MELSVDIGFGDTKYIIKNDEEQIKGKFPTAITRVSIKVKDDKDVYKFRNGYYRIGYGAVEKAEATRNMKFLVRFAPLIVYHILKENNIKNLDELKIRSGISLFYYEDYKEQFKEALKNIKVNDEEINTKVKLFAQGQGILYDFLSINPEAENLKSIVIVDIGYNTIDFLYLKNENGSFKPYKEECFGLPQGAHIIVNLLKDYLQEEYKVNLTEQETNQILRDGYFTFRGKKIDLTDVISDLKNEYTFKILNLLENRTDLIDRADKIVFGGGGAYFLDKDELPEHSFIVKEPEFSNVRGYLKK